VELSRDQLAFGANETTKTFTVTLSNPSGAAQLGARGTATDLSPRALIAQLLPDVLVKGGDYNLDEIHGREEVEAAGGRVISLPFVAGASTSTILERMRNA